MPRDLPLDNSHQGCPGKKNKREVPYVMEEREREREREREKERERERKRELISQLSSRHGIM